MNNRQALVSAAMLEAIWGSRKKDMIDLITPFILYAVAKQTSHGAQINTKAVQKFVQEKNAYPDLPEAIVKAALSRNPHNAIEKKGKSFFLVKPLDSEVNHMDQRRRECDEHISKIGDQLSLYLSTHCKKSFDFSSDNAISWLHSFFSRYGLEVGTDNLANVRIRPEVYEIDYYIARFIFECHDSNAALYSSIADLVKGYFLRLAIYVQPENGNIQAASYAKTSFVLDTPFLIDLLGYKGEERKQNAVSLTKMLNRQKAKLYYFPHIKQEIIDVLTAYKYSLVAGSFSEGGRTLEGLNIKGYDISDVEREVQLCESKLESIYHIVEKDMPAYATKADNTVDESQVLDEEGIKQYIKENTPHYSEANLNNDIASVLAIHKLRAGERSRNIESCRFVFVTNNIDFIHAFNRYYRENVDNGTFQLVISVNALSAITWIKCGEVENLTETELLKNAYCAMQPIPEIMIKLEEVLSQLKESGDIQPEQVVALRASRVFQNDLWINSFGDLESINEFSVKKAQKKYEEALIAEEAERHEKEVSEIKQQYLEEMGSIQSELHIQRQNYSREIDDLNKTYSEYVKKRNEEERIRVKKQHEEIRKRADSYASSAREKWFERRASWLRAIIGMLFLLGIIGLIFSVTFEASLWISIPLGVYLLISGISVCDTVFSKEAFLIKLLRKRSFTYETKVREEKISEYTNLLPPQDRSAEKYADDLVQI